MGLDDLVHTLSRLPHLCVLGIRGVRDPLADLQATLMTMPSLTTVDIRSRVNADPLTDVCLHNAINAQRRVSGLGPISFVAFDNILGQGDLGLCWDLAIFRTVRLLSEERVSWLDWHTEGPVPGEILLALDDPVVVADCRSELRRPVRAGYFKS